MSNPKRSRLRRARKLRRAMRESPEHYKGKVYEDYFEIVLKELVDTGFIDGYERTMQYSYFDKRGIDFFLYKDRDIVIPFQVTSTKKRCLIKLNNRPHIPVIYSLNSFNNLYSLATLARKAKWIIYKYLWRLNKADTFG